jgi:hypothetical protein
MVSSLFSRSFCLASPDQRSISPASVIYESFLVANKKINDPSYNNIGCSISGGSDSDIMLDIISKVDENFHKVDENKVNDYCSFKKQTIINRNPLPKKDYELIIHILKSNLHFLNPFVI